MIQRLKKAVREKKMSVHTPWMEKANPVLRQFLKHRANGIGTSPAELPILHKEKITICIQRFRPYDENLRDDDDDDEDYTSDDDIMRWAKLPCTSNTTNVILYDTPNSKMRGKKCPCGSWTEEPWQNHISAKRCHIQYNKRSHEISLFRRVDICHLSQLNEENFSNMYDIVMNPPSLMSAALCTLINKGAYHLPNEQSVDNLLTEILWDIQSKEMYKLELRKYIFSPGTYPDITFYEVRRTLLKNAEFGSSLVRNVTCKQEFYYPVEDYSAVLRDGQFMPDLSFINQPCCLRHQKKDFIK